MPRYAFKLRIKADAIEEYDREHTRVWPELLAKLKAVGISDYSVFRRGQDLLLCMKVADFDAVAVVGEIRRRAVREAVDKAHLQEASAGSEAGTPTEEPIPESEPEPPNKFCSGLFLGRLPDDYDIDAAIDCGD